MTKQQLLCWGEERLKEANIEEASIDAWYLMEYALSTNRMDFLMNRNQTVCEKQVEQYQKLIEQRASHIPLQHLTGVQEFMGYSFKVNEFVLIPRQDTELLVEEVLKKADGKRVLDMCTGSGCIIISLSKFSNLQKAVGVDISKEALKVAKENVIALEANVDLIESDLFSHLNKEEPFDIIVSNPPYIESSEVDKLMPEVKDHEPRLALDGMEDGLYFYRKIVKEAKHYLTKNGALFFEIGYNQGKAVCELMIENGYKEVKVIKDLCGLDRVVTGIY